MLQPINNLAFINGFRKGIHVSLLRIVSASRSFGERDDEKLFRKEICSHSDQMTMTDIVTMLRDTVTTSLCADVTAGFCIKVALLIRHLGVCTCVDSRPYRPF